MQSQLGEPFFPFCLRCRMYRHGNDYKVMVYENQGEKLTWNDCKVSFYIKESNCLMGYWKTIKGCLLSRERSNEN